MKRVIRPGRFIIYCHEVVEVVRAKKTADNKQEPIVSVRHAGEWDQNRHGPSFLRPLVDGERRRLAAAAVKASPRAGPPD
ncbi:MAG: hypothetical protein RIN56_02050 [Sporomusaceae bacterium]|nr:hypothetical protein [Sporomusaceae bacterium]